MKLLIANRGEIARRIIRTAHRVGYQTIAVYADPDANAPHVSEATVAVNIGPAALADSYLSIERIIAAATDNGATAVHPGYGFLAENAEFARAVIAAGMTWVGPHPEAIDQMGSKIEARRLAAAAGVPIIPGFDESQDGSELAAAADRIGYPVLVKAAAGGGGKGIRVVWDPADFDAALTEASTEAQRSFGNGDMIVERYIQRPRHIEVQVVGDKHGTTADLGTRECSVQRRYQKVLEEAPAPNLPDATRSGLRTSAVQLGASIRYDSAGTVEFIVDDETGEHFFLEMNTRLQVEHPVTELITGIDLVEVMLRVAEGQVLRIPDDLTISGHAIEVRINAEDPANDFTPQLGTIHQLAVPAGVRWDAAVEVGSEISPHYDSMIAKLITVGRDRDEALAAMRTALDALIVGGVVTNTGLQRWLLDQPEITEARVTTRFLDENQFEPQVSADQARSLAAQAWVATESNPSATPWRLADFAMTPRTPTSFLGLRDEAGVTADERVEGSVTTQVPNSIVDLTQRRVSVNLAGQTFSYDLPSRTERWIPSATERAGSGDAIVAPFPASVAEVHVAAGDQVEGNQVLVVIEAMKMLHSLTASGASTIDEVRVKVGDQVATDQTLVTFASDEDK